MKTIYEYAIIFNPDEDTEAESEIVVKPTHILASDEREATILASRKIPDQYLDKLDRISLAVRPF